MNTKSTNTPSVQRPLILEIEEAKAAIINSVNACLRKGLPCYIVADILNGVHSQLRDGARRELENARLMEAQSETTEKEDSDNG